MEQNSTQSGIYFCTADNNLYFYDLAIAKYRKIGQPPLPPYFATNPSPAPGQLTSVPTNLGADWPTTGVYFVCNFSNPPIPNQFFGFPSVGQGSTRRQIANNCIGLFKINHPTSCDSTQYNAMVIESPLEMHKSDETIEVQTDGLGQSSI
jgi:hypothetical protein